MLELWLCNNDSTNAFKAGFLGNYFVKARWLHESAVFAEATSISTIKYYCT